MAATLTDSGDLTYISFPITKSERTPDGDLYVYGKATDGSVDSDEQIVDPEWSAKAIQSWLSSGGNVRVQHNSQRDPAGIGIEANTDAEGATWVKSLIVEPVAKRLVEKGVLRAYSVGISRPDIVRDPIARGGRIKGGPSTEIVEISLVDRPANKNCGVQLVKSASDGLPEFVDELFGPDDIILELKGVQSASDADMDRLITKLQSTVGNVINKTADPETVSVELPTDVSVSFSPADLAKLLKHRAVAEERAASDATEKRKMDPDVGGGVDRDKIPAADFAGSGRSFPIVTPGDVSDAASSIGRAGEGNFSSDKLKSNIISIARRKGPSFVAELPDSWKEEIGVGKMEPDAELEKGKKKKGGAFEGAAKPFGSSDDDDDEKDDEKDDEAKPDATKGEKDCDCGASHHADSKLRICEKCGGKLPKADKSSDPDVVKNGPGSMSCSGCGSASDEDHSFCSHCGLSLKGVPAPQVQKKKKKKGKPTPGDGVVGPGAAGIDPIPAHREPDGMAIESFEHDAGLPTDPDSRYMKAADRHKSVGAPHDLGALHDHLCAAFEPSDVAKCFQADAFSELSAVEWQQKALDAAASAPLDEARHMALMWQHAVTIKGTDPEVIAELRDELHKEFTDANKGPGSFPTPTELSPTRFRRPALTAGQAQLSSGHAGPNTHSVPTSDMSADDFSQGYQSAGRAEQSPANKGSGVIEPAPLPPGMSRTYYRNALRDSAKSAMQAMHDHIAQTFPDLCPMAAPGLGGEPPVGARPVPLPVGKSEEDPEMTAKAQELIEQAREAANAAGLEGVFVEKAATVSDGAVEPEAPVFGDIMKSALAEATNPLVEKLAALMEQFTAQSEQLAVTQKALRKQQKRLDALGDLPDPREAPFKGLAMQNTANKSATGVPVAARTVAENAERTQLALMQSLQLEARNNPDPAQREAAWSRLYQMTGINP